jgi:hypothetical protein
MIGTVESAGLALKHHENRIRDDKKIEANEFELLASAF